MTEDVSVVFPSALDRTHLVPLSAPPDPLSDSAAGPLSRGSGEEAHHMLERLPTFRMRFKAIGAVETGCGLQPLAPKGNDHDATYSCGKRVGKSSASEEQERYNTMAKDRAKKVKKASHGLTGLN